MQTTDSLAITAGLRNLFEKPTEPFRVVASSQVKTNVQNEPAAPENFVRETFSKIMFLPNVHRVIPEAENLVRMV